ncbi:MAG: ankyrin repeat domain-containing protein [Candidatus Micrarchaeota archaeon]|nr:ankyrin repeat domain-containing protein [Candidatus Micrarchaeota archaeon]
MLTIQREHAKNTAFLKQKNAAEPLSEKLTKAIISNNFEEAKNAINKGADPNWCDKNGLTPLFYAIMKGNYDIVELLIKSNADVNAEANKNGNAMVYAVYKGDIRIVKLLKQSGCTKVEAALAIALQHTNYDIVEALTEKM